MDHEEKWEQQVAFAGDRPPLLVAGWHGRLCGMLSGPLELDEVSALHRALQLPGTQLDENFLRDALNSARQALENPALDFAPQIPHADEDLRLRTRALAEWCRGFLEGFALSSDADRQAALPADTAELLADLSRIAAELEQSVEAVTEADDDERDFYEISEFVRIAALNIFLGRQAGCSPAAGN